MFSWFCGTRRREPSGLLPSGHPLAGIGNLKCTAAHTSSHAATHATSHAATLLLSTQTAAGLEWI